ncbi:hypothetical protein AB0368_01280 [Actinoplanes sp. NPDC051475]|uniref:hypothetical protein n=1 Tax=Actinoplanes sp. NPDC051475 TaxID=3157225 RepID=UPI003450F7E7
MIDATDRSMPPVATTKVCPTARTTRMAEAISIERTLPLLRNVGLRIWKMITSASRPTRAAHSAQKPTSLRRWVQGSVSRAATVAVVMLIRRSGP